MRQYYLTDQRLPRCDDGMSGCRAAGARTSAATTCGWSASSTRAAATSWERCPFTTKFAICRSRKGAGLTRWTMPSGGRWSCSAMRARILFPGRPAIGSYILLNGSVFKLLEPCNESGTATIMAITLSIIMPYHTMQTRFPPLNVGETVNAISLHELPADHTPGATLRHRKVQKIVARNHGFDAAIRIPLTDWIR